MQFIGQSWAGIQGIQDKTPGKEAARECPDADAGEWRMVISGARPLATETAPSVQLGNKYEALAPLEECAVGGSALEGPAAIIEQAEHRPGKQQKRRLIIIVGNPLLRGTEGSICHLDPMAHEVCCLPRARIRDGTMRIPDLIQPSDNYPIVLIHVGTNDAARSSPDRIISDYKALGTRLRKTGEQVVFLSILLVSGHSRHHVTSVREVNPRLWSWCHRAGFGFLNHDLHFHARDLLGRNELHFSIKA
ncbi:uncharacterized protein LOC112551557 isoform X2 [Alligator sinensis]|uniref:Uncharacterized protein LOC112551557 isoform X2 n=1 Tax=Alligator sinensis TaxID=38654 RepID=A0A3Q0HBI8_ALLSI|nr:uncharacterized protein LOC112551557 isoform X2 [Alligator sinensis]